MLPDRPFITSGPLIAGWTFIASGSFVTDWPLVTRGPLITGSRLVAGWIFIAGRFRSFLTLPSFLDLGAGSLKIAVRRDTYFAIVIGFQIFST